jgi:hypothetical protein
MLDRSARSTLFYVVDWLPPEFGAVGQYGLIFARQIAAAGQDVCLLGLTSGNRMVVREFSTSGGSLEVRRLHRRRYDKTGMISRLLWSLVTDLRLCWEVIRDPQSRGAELIFTGSPPFMLFSVFLVKLFRGASLTYRITDFYPEVLIAALGRRAPGLRLVQQLTWFLRRRVDRFEVLGEDQRRLLIAGGIEPQRITVKRDISPISFSGVASVASIPKELSGFKILLYSGNYGVAHETETIISGLIQHHTRGRARFGLWLNASGSNVKRVKERLEAAGVPVAHTEPVSLDRLPDVLRAADAHLITLRPQFSGLVLPSKLYACVESRKPTIFVGPKSSDVHLVCSQANDLDYDHVEPGDVDRFAQALDMLDDADRVRSLEAVSC